jgi:hypothetical protein
MTDSIKPTPKLRVKSLSTETPKSIRNRNNATPTTEDRSCEFGGSPSKPWNNWMIDQALVSTPQYVRKDGTPIDILEISLAGLHGIGPKDVMEGMLAAQLLASHNGAMDCYQRATDLKYSMELRLESAKLAAKLSKAHAALVEALNKHRGKGQQKVTVEHVHVHPGGQAIVGTVTHPGGGRKQKT